MCVWILQNGCLVEMSPCLEWFVSLSERIRLLKWKNTSLWMKEYVSLGERIRLLEWKKPSSGVQGYNFLKVVTRLGRSAEPSQQVCSLQSAGLASLVGWPVKSCNPRRDFLMFFMRMLAFFFWTAKRNCNYFSPIFCIFLQKSKQKWWICSKKQ